MNNDDYIIGAGWTAPPDGYENVWVDDGQGGGTLKRVKKHECGGDTCSHAICATHYIKIDYSMRYGCELGAVGYSTRFATNGEPDDAKAITWAAEKAASKDVSWLELTSCLDGENIYCYSRSYEELYRKYYAPLFAAMGAL